MNPLLSNSSFPFLWLGIWSLICHFGLAALWNLKLRCVLKKKTKLHFCKYKILLLVGCKIWKYLPKYLVKLPHNTKYDSVNWLGPVRILVRLSWSTPHQLYVQSRPDLGHTVTRAASRDAKGRFRSTDWHALSRSRGTQEDAFLVLLARS